MSLVQQVSSCMQIKESLVAELRLTAHVPDKKYLCHLIEVHEQLISLFVTPFKVL